MNFGIKKYSLKGINSTVPMLKSAQEETPSGWQNFNNNLSGSANSVSNLLGSIGGGVSQISQGLNQFKPTVTFKGGLDSTTLMVIAALVLFIFRKKIF